MLYFIFNYTQYQVCFHKCDNYYIHVPMYVHVHVLIPCTVLFTTIQCLICTCYKVIALIKKKLFVNILMALPIRMFIE